MDKRRTLVSFINSRSASVILSSAFFFYKKSVGICICYRPSVGGFSHCLSLLDGNAEAHACICNQDFRTIFLPKYRAESIYYISTGIYRCSTLDRE
ncbi:hypothetical protein AAK873_11800 [Heminiphilus faecis]|uniref:Uncharacterized protein n=1 Tax=Heminiphilus faecis TaxID=2601703 RepID=A0ABV4CY26_9BACT